MGYSAVRGGAIAIEAAEDLIKHLPIESEEALVELRQLRNQYGAAVDKVMGEGGVYAPDLAALAIRQTEGDLFEAAFLLRAYRSTLPRLGYTVAMAGREMSVVRRISSAFRDIPGGQLLGRTRDYTQRLLDFSQMAPAKRSASVNGRSNGRPTDGSASDAFANGLLERLQQTEISPDLDGHMPKVSDVMRNMGLVAPLPDHTIVPEPFDITRESMRFPVTRPAWLQAMARGESGALVCLAYTSLRGYGGRADHGTIAELRVGDLPLRMTHPLTGQPVTIGQMRVTEVEMVGNERHAMAPGAKTPSFGLSYGIVFGQHERKAIAMALLDSSLQAPPPIEGDPPPANDQEMVLYHIDGIESFGFVEHLKLPHFVTFGSHLQMSIEQNNAAAAANGASPSEAHSFSDAKPHDDDDHEGVAAGQVHSHGGGEPHSHDD